MAPAAVVVLAGTNKHAHACCVPKQGPALHAVGIICNRAVSRDLKHRRWLDGFYLFSLEELRSVQLLASSGPGEGTVDHAKLSLSISVII